ncbi:hypothetical protein PG996_004297 [Apiospora saccharicola]|uniref:Uncharacterized protein n=1 Tax=Apiospora saccharicola TaxID=335842 RepID=A0ABR1W4Z6_9PEZI
MTPQGYEQSSSSPPPPSSSPARPPPPPAEAAEAPTCLKAWFHPSDRAQCTAPDGSTSTFLRVQLDREFHGQLRCFNLGATYSVSVSYTAKGGHAQGSPVKALNGPVRVADGATGQYDFDFPIRYGDIEPGTHVTVAAEAKSSDGKFGGTEERSFVYKGAKRLRRGRSPPGWETPTMEEPELIWTHNETSEVGLHGLVAERGATYALPQC